MRRDQSVRSLFFSLMVTSAHFQGCTATLQFSPPSPPFFLPTGSRGLPRAMLSCHRQGHRFLKSFRPRLSCDPRLKSHPCRAETISTPCHVSSHVPERIRRLSRLTTWHGVHLTSGNARFCFFQYTSSIGDHIIIQFEYRLQFPPKDAVRR